jgi:hypothetical protein
MTPVEGAQGRRRYVKLSVNGRKSKVKKPGKEHWAKVRLPEILGNQGRTDKGQTEDTDGPSHKGKP